MKIKPANLAHVQQLLEQARKVATEEAGTTAAPRADIDAVISEAEKAVEQLTQAMQAKPVTDESLVLAYLSMAVAALRELNTLVPLDRYPDSTDATSLLQSLKPEA